MNAKTKMAQLSEKFPPVPAKEQARIIAEARKIMSHKRNGIVLIIPVNADNTKALGGMVKVKSVERMFQLQILCDALDLTVLDLAMMAQYALGASGNDKKSKSHSHR